MAVEAVVRLGAFKAWLSVWIGLAIAAGLALGWMFPQVFATLGGFTYAHVNPVTAILVWLLILPTMIQIDYSRLTTVWARPEWRAGSAITLGVNWVLKPFSMALLAMLFFKFVFVDGVSAADADQYIAGLVLLGVAPCTGMVFVWSRMTSGDAEFTLAQVSVNDLVLLVAFAPIAGLLLGLGGVSVPWATLGISTTVYVIIPLISGFIIRKLLQWRSETALANLDSAVGPLTKIGLITLVVLLFGFQAETVLTEPTIIAMIAIPLLIQSYGIFALAFGAAWVARLPARVAGPATLIGTSNFFELAVAIAVVLFGVGSPAVIATVVGVLVEVPVMLTLIALINRAAPMLDARHHAIGLAANA